MAVDPSFWAAKKVFVTGHTGFKGSWLCAWLAQMGARVMGYALDPPSNPSMFADASISELIECDVRADICDKIQLSAAIDEFQSEIVFHLAAQSLVPEGYADPIKTYETNVIGTGNVLLSAFSCGSVRSVVSVASDKCYENREWVHPYRETDRLGGTDPYSSSKGCAELLTNSFCASLERKTRVASVRAGNVIGGGDWAGGRLVPDCIRAFSAGKPVELRRPQSIRPWQLVLEPLAGYLLLAQAMTLAKDDVLEGAWNFGPVAGGELTAQQLSEKLASAWGADARVRTEHDGIKYKEANLLRLDSTKARVELGWGPLLSGEESVDWTARWYAAWRQKEDLQAVTLAQIQTYMDRL